MVRTDTTGVAINRLEGDYMQHYPDDDSYEITKARAIGQQPGSPITIGTSNTAIMDQGGERIVMKRSEEHTSELQSLMRISYAVFCLKKKKQNRIHEITMSITIP